MTASPTSLEATLTDDDERVTNAAERRCKADTKRGRCRVVRGIDDQGLCAMHSGATDPRELGRLSGKRRREPNPSRVHQNLREYLRENVEPSEVWAALKLAMEGQNESARVAASRVLMDALHEPKRSEAEERDDAAETEAARKVVLKLVIDSIVEILEGKPKTGLAHMAAAYLDERQRQRIAELHTLRLDQIRAASVDDLTREALAGV